MSTTKNAKQAALDKAQEAMGAVPNLIKAMAERNPMLAHMYLDATRVFETYGVLPRAEQQFVLAAISAKNGCHYCTAAHRTVARKLEVSQEELDRVDRLEVPRDERLKALATASWMLMDKRGLLSDGEQKELKQAGLSEAELLEIVALLGVKTLSNYFNHLVKTEIDPAFQAQATRQP